MNTTKSTDYGAFLLRVSLGLIMIAHGAYLKLIVFGLPGTAQFFTSIGLPGPLAYLVVIAETFGGIALILGIYTRYVALALIPIALGATWVHLGNGWVFSNEGGGWEFPFFLVATLVVQSLIGSGAYAIKKS